MPKRDHDEASNRAPGPDEKLAFSAAGPTLGGVPLTRRVRKGWVPTEQEILERELVTIASFGAADFVRRLDAVCKAMNIADFATAAIVAEHVTRDLESARGRMRKASPDDPKRPGWPAGTPDRKGGRFRPKDGVAPEAKETKLRRLAARRGLRSDLRRLLTFRRAARLAAEMFGDTVPGLDVVTGAATLADVLKLTADAAADAADTEAAIAFAEKGPEAIEELQMSTEAESFPSYGAFRKDDLDKRFGPAGDGYEYHHIVEQGPNASTFAPEQLQSTENIVRIPRLVHEDVNSAFATTRQIEGKFTSVRDYLQGRSFAEQRDWGLRILQEVGAIY